MTDAAFWSGRSVLVTGHTGFKGSWLSAWLLRLGARLHGIGLPPDTTPSLFDQLRLGDRMQSHVLDIRDEAAVRETLRGIAPEIVLHLAAQPLVRQSYAEPLRTWGTNVMGTANLLDAVTALGQPCAVVVVTTDKVYRNNEWVHSYRETDRLGGHDPYSASKAATELLVESWRRSFLCDGRIRLASARAGNVIGGGDWARDRIVPDLMRALSAGRRLTVRNPASTRPWQHVLDPLHAYLTLAQRLAGPGGTTVAHAYNFGPDPSAERSVASLVDAALTHWPGAWHADGDAAAVHEAGRLALATARAREELGWSPRWGFERSVAETVAWYRGVDGGADPCALCDGQIARYEAT